MHLERERVEMSSLIELISWWCDRKKKIEIQWDFQWVLENIGCTTIIVVIFIPFISFCIKLFIIFFFFFLREIFFFLFLHYLHCFHFSL